MNKFQQEGDAGALYIERVQPYTQGGALYSEVQCIMGSDRQTDRHTQLKTLASLKFMGSGKYALQ